MLPLHYFLLLLMLEDIEPNTIFSQASTSEKSVSSSHMVKFLFFLLSFAIFFVLMSTFPMHVYTHYHIKIDLFEGGHRTECYASACALIFKLIAMYSTKKMCMDSPVCKV